MRKSILSLLFVLTLVLSVTATGFADAATGQMTQSVANTSVKLVQTEVKAWEMIEFKVSNAPATENAWVGLFEYKYVDEGEVYYWSSDYASKIMVENLGSTPYFDTPRNANETQYVIAVFDRYGYDLTPVAISDPVLVHYRYTPPNSFIPEEAEAARAYYNLVSDAKSDGTYDIKATMNNDFFNPNITDAEIARYQAFLNSDTLHEYERKNVQGADGMWTQIGPSENWLSFSTDYSEEDSDAYSYTYDNEAYSDITYDGSGPTEDIQVVISDTLNYGPASGSPSTAATFTIDGPHTITYIELLYAPVTEYVEEYLSLVDQNGMTYGPWEAFVDLPYEDEPYSLCYADIYAEIPAGTYRIEVENPSRWLNNADSGYAGMAFVEGSFKFKTGPSAEDVQYTIPERIFDNTNSNDCEGSPVTTTLFFLNQAYTITQVDLRYNADIASTGETISIVNTDGVRFGSWETVVDPNYRNNPSVYCRVAMNTELPAGAYRIEVAHPDKWLCDSSSKFAGMATLEGRPLAPSNTSEIVYGSVLGMTWNHEGNFCKDVTIKCFQNGKFLIETNSQDTAFYTYNLPIGSYDFEFSRIGYETQYFEDMRIVKVEPLRVDVHMEKIN